MYNQTFQILFFAVSAFFTSAYGAQAFSLDLEKVELEDYETHPLLKENLSKEEVRIGEESNTHYYQMKMYFGSSKQPAKLIMDMSSAQTLVTSELCTYCPTMTYKPGESTSVEDLGSQWDLKYPELGMRFKTIAYRDQVCMDHNTTMLCVDDYTFYSIYKQRGMKQWQGGIVGMGPMPQGDDSDKTDSFIYQLAQQVEIKRPMFSIFIANHNNLTSIYNVSNIMFGDFNTSFIAGGEEAIQWFDLTNKTSWQLYLSWAHFGDKMLFQHDFKEVSINMAVPYIGVDDDTWFNITNALSELDSSIICDRVTCYGTKSQAHYASKLPDFSLKVSNKQVYTVAGPELMDFTAGNNTYTCRFALYNSGYHFVLGEYFLRNYYAIYDIQHLKMGLAPVKDYIYHTNEAHNEAALADTPEKIKEKEKAEEDAANQEEKKKKTGLVIVAMVVLFVISCGLGYWGIKKRRANKEDKLLKLQASGHEDGVSDESDGSDDGERQVKKESPNDVLLEYAQQN